MQAQSFSTESVVRGLATFWKGASKFDSRRIVPFGAYLAFLSIRTACCHRLGALSVRCMQPDQQQGRLFPSSNSSQVRSIRRWRVFGCLASSTQQINSLRPSGVRSCQSANVSGLNCTAACISFRALWTVPWKKASGTMRFHSPRAEHSQSSRRQVN